MDSEPKQLGLTFWGLRTLDVVATFAVEVVAAAYKTVLLLLIIKTVVGISGGWWGRVQDMLIIYYDYMEVIKGKHRSYHNIIKT